MDIQVTVGRPRGSPVPPPVAPVDRANSNLDGALRQRSSALPGEQPSGSEPTITSSALPSRLPGRPTTGRQSSVPIFCRPPHTPATTVKTPGSAIRKRKVSFEDAALAAPEKPAAQCAPTSIYAKTLIVPPETSAAPKPVGAEKPPKKKQKKEATKGKDVQPAGASQSTPAKASDVSKPKPKKSTALDHESEVGTVSHMDASAHI